MAMRFGLFGTGYWAAETHGAVLAAHPSAELVGVWGRDPAKAQALAGRYGTRAYHDVDALIDEADAVAVALPPDVQADVAARAAEAGRHLMLDKPLAFTTAAADRVVTAVAAHGSASLVFFTARFHPATEEFVAATAAQPGWHGARAVRFSANFAPGSPYAGSAWRRERGGLWDVGPHVLSVLLPVLGPVAEVVAMAGPRTTTHVLLRHTGGAVSTLGLTVDAAPAAVTSHVVLFGEPGTVEVPNHGGTARQAFGRAVDQLVLAAAGGPPPACDVRFGREVVAVLAAAERAHHLGRSVPVDPA